MLISNYLICVNQTSALINQISHVLNGLNRYRCFCLFRHLNDVTTEELSRILHKNRAMTGTSFFSSLSFLLQIYSIHIFKNGKAI